MPKVGGKSYSYSKKGVAAAKAASKRSGKKMTNTKKKKQMDDEPQTLMEVFEEFPELMGERYNPFDDDTPLECGLENPDVCESCQ